MFAVHCPRHDAQVLIWTSAVDAVINTTDGIAVAYDCTCGHRGLWFANGREAPRPLATSSA
jgi:hypothetical protein